MKKPTWILSSAVAAVAVAGLMVPSAVMADTSAGGPAQGGGDHGSRTAGVTTPTMPSTGTYTWSLDDDAVGSVPVACGTPTGRGAMTVTAAQAPSGQTHSVDFTDNGTVLSQLQCTTPVGRIGGDGGHLQVQVYPQQMQWGFFLDLSGTTANGAVVPSLFHIQFDADDNSIQWYENYDGGGWLTSATSTGLKTGQWNTIDIATTSDDDMAYIWVNGHYMGSAGAATVNQASAITGFLYSGTGTARTGDNVYLGSPTMGPAIPARPEAITSQYQIGRRHIITTGLQMPSSVVQVAGPQGGQRLLMDSSGTVDSATGNANYLFSSDDGGRTWNGDQAENPWPDGQTFSMTRLANGELFAAEFDTYTTLPNGTVAPANEAVVATAVSTNGGQTWTKREGVMTAPQALAPFTCGVAGVGGAPGCTSFTVQRGVIQSKDGALYQGVYGRFATDASGMDRSGVMVSTDGGVDWTLEGTVSAPSEPYSESALSWGAGSRMFMVTRDNSYLPYTIEWSSDLGKTWSTPQPLTGGGVSPVESVDPEIVTLRDRSLVLLTGRPGMALLRSTDGGVTWSRQTWVDYSDSGNGAIASIGGDQIVMVGDRGQNWLNPAPLVQSEWSRTITVAGR